MMTRRNITIDIYNKVIDKIPTKIIEMLPESPEKLLKYATRIKNINFAPTIDDETKKLMEEHLLTDEEYLKTFYYVMAISFYNKNKVDFPELVIVSAQTGSGKSNLTAKILRDDNNYVFIDSDKYKHYRFDAVKISKEFPLLYPFFTGPDAYDQAENIYSYALDHNYNIIKETAPSKNKNLLGTEITQLKDKNYNISLHVLAVSNLNSLLSVHERYELQILSGLKTAKLTDIERHNESYEALIPCVNEVYNDINNIKIYTRGNLENNFNPIKVYPGNYNSPEEAIKISREKDFCKTVKEFDGRYNLIIAQMKERKAPNKQYQQIELIKKLVLTR